MADEPPDDDDDLPLFARTSDPDTSHESMAGFSRERLRSAMKVVVQLFERWGPMADFELEPRFRAVWPKGCRHLYRQARSSARDRGQVKDTGVKIRNPASNKHQIVWARCQGLPVIIEKCPTCGHVLGRHELDRSADPSLPRPPAES